MLCAALVMSLALALCLCPMVPSAQAASSTTSYTSYSMYAYRDAAYGTPPNGVASTNGCHFVIQAMFPEALTLSDASAAAASFSISSDSSVGTASTRVITVTAQDKTLSVDVTTDYMPGGVLQIAAATINGLTCGGKTVSWPSMNTVVPTGLKFHVTNVTLGTATTRASTTIEIDHSAVLRSMNHILWTSNGSSILANSDGSTAVGTAQTSAAHHHMFYSFTLKDSATAIQSNAGSLATYGYTASVSSDGYSVTLTDTTAKAGEYLGIYNYDDTFLQAHGLTLSDHVSGLTAPTASSVRDLSTRADVTIDDAVAYTESAVEPTVTVSDGRYGTLTKGTDYSVAYTDNTEIGTATATITGIGNYSGSVTKTFRIAPELSASDFTVDTSAVPYKGAAYLDRVTSTLVEGTDYTASYTDNAFPGTATITITGAGSYMGTLTYHFDITPATATITKAKAGKKKLTLAWTKTGVKTYQVQYRVKSAKKWKSKNATTTSLVLKKLKSGKRYQVRILSANGSYKKYSKTLTTKKIA